MLTGALPFSATESRGSSDGEAQEASHLHRRAEQPPERLAARIIDSLIRKPEYFVRLSQADRAMLEPAASKA
jgi:hypothetical protein